MTSQSSCLNQETFFNQEKALDDRKVLAMQEEIELLREQVESVKRMLSDECQITNEYVQELAYTKQELEWMNDEMFNLITLNRQPIDEAKELAKGIVEKKKSLSESIAELLSAIYRSPVQVNEIEKIDASSLRSRLDKFKAQSFEIRTQFDKIIAHSCEVKLQSYQVTERSRQLRLNSREVRQGLRREVSYKAS